MNFQRQRANSELLIALFLLLQSGKSQKRCKSRTSTSHTQVFFKNIFK